MDAASFAACKHLRTVWALVGIFALLVSLLVFLFVHSGSESCVAEVTKKITGLTMDFAVSFKRRLCVASLAADVAGEGIALVLTRVRLQNIKETSALNAELFNFEAPGGTEVLLIFIFLLRLLSKCNSWVKILGWTLFAV